MLKKASRIASLRYQYTMSCCGKSYGPTPGPIPKNTQFICQHCRKEMKPVQTEVRSLEECELIDAHRTRFNGEACVDCGSQNNHHVRHDPELDAYFLDCGRCGEELREVEWKELES